MDQKPFFSIIIPSYEGAENLSECLNSIDRQTFRDFEVIVVDNGSRQDLRAAVLKFSFARIIRIEKNNGLPPAFNIGIKNARADWIFLLNNDTLLPDDFFAKLAAGMETHHGFDIYVPKTLFSWAKDTINTAGTVPRVSGSWDDIGLKKKDSPDFNVPKEVFGGCGVAIAMKRKMFDQMGMFDEDYFLYCEDVDIAWRSRAYGYKAFYLPSAFLYHKWGQSTKGSKMPHYYISRNSVYNIVKYIHGIDLLFSIAWFFGKMALSIFRLNPESIKGLLDGLLAVPVLLGKRKKIWKDATVQYKDVAKWARRIWMPMA